MDALQHSFNLYSSFGQRLSLTVIAAICLTSFLIWPYSESLFIFVSKILTFTSCCGFFAWQYWRLRNWNCQFILSADGHGCLNQQQRFIVNGKPLVTPFAVIFDVACEAEIKRLVVWRPMLDDTNYRNLCRLLLLAYRNRLK